MRILKIMLPLLVLLTGSAAAHAQNEEGAVYTLTTRCIPQDAGSTYPSSSTYTADQSVNVYCNANPGFNFLRWEDDLGNEISTEIDFNFTMPSADVSLIARFEYDPSTPEEPSVPEIKKFVTVHLDMDPENRGYVRVAGNNITEPSDFEYEVGTEALFYAYSNKGFRFVNWTEEGVEISDSPALSFIVEEGGRSIVANYEFDSDTWADLMLYSNPTDGGSAELSGEYIFVNEGCPSFRVGSTARLDPLPLYGFKFVNWSENGEVISTSPTLSYIVEKGTRSITINYEYDPDVLEEPGEPKLHYKLNQKSNPENATSGLFGQGDYLEGETAWVRGNINEFYNFINWTDEEGNVVSDVFEFYYIMPQRHVTLTANFSYNYTYDPSVPDEPGAPDINDSGITERPRISMYDPTHVIMLSSTTGATIRYTLDGTEPNSQSEVYTSPVFVPSNLVVKAYAVKDGLEDSPVTTYQVTAYHAEIPVFSFENYKVCIKSATPGAVIHYSLSRNDPTEDSPVYEEPLELADGAVVKAIAYAENLTPSDVTHFVFQKSKYEVAAPTFSLGEDGKLIIIPAVEGSTIRYTLDKTKPNVESTVYTGPLALDGNFSVRAYTTHVNYYDSPVSEYVIEGFKVETPSCAYLDKALSLSVVTEGAEIRYTVDGSVPTEASTLYSEPLRLTEDCKVVARGFKANYEPSDTISYNFVYTQHQVEAPVLTYEPTALTVTMTCATENAEIRYTTDGSEPTATTGTKYETPIAVVGNHTYTARAFRSDLFDSEVSTLEVTDQTVPTPTASFSNRHLTLECSDAEAVIVYTTDGSTPTEVSTAYTVPIPLTEDCTVNFMAVREGFNNSDVVAFEFKVSDHQVAMPAFAYDSQTSMLTLSCPTENAEIRYTTDGSEPTATTGTKYEAPIKLEGNATYKARAFRSDLLDSKVVSLVINDQTVPTPTASFANRHLTLTCEDEEAVILYTVDGTVPTSESAIYTAPVALTVDCTVNFLAQRENFNDSEIGTFQFKVADYQVAKPLFSFDTETGNVTIACSTENAEIRYTTDGSIPTSENGIKYEGAIPVVGNFSFNARAFRSDLFDSETASLTVNDNQLPMPTASFANKHLTLSCADTQATIYYTTDGTVPTIDSSVYEAPIALTQSCTVRFFAVRENFNDSEEAAFQFQIADYRVSTPVLTYNPKESSLTISCATENAEIRYTDDGSEPTALSGIRYEGPISFYGNFTFNARAFRSDLYDSETASLAISGQKVYAPTATFSNRHLTLECSDAEAVIVYTTDGSTPTGASTAYMAPIPLTEDCTVNFMAVREGFNNSDVVAFEFKVSDHQVAVPVVSHSRETMKATMTCATENAEIRYTTDGTVPTAATGVLYETPIDLTGNLTFTVKAFRSDLFDSETIVYEVNDMKLPTPTASYGKRALTLNCEDTSVEIHYTTDGTAPTEASTLYSEPIPLNANCTVRFIATKSGYNNSDEANYVFTLADWQEKKPTEFIFDYTSRRIAVLSDEDISFRIVTGDVDRIVAPAEEFDVDPSMASMSVTALATNEDRYDSETNNLELVFHLPPTLTYDGHELGVTPSADDPSPSGIECSLFFDGELVANASRMQVKISRFCDVLAIAKSDNAFVSDSVFMSIDAFNTGRLAAARNGHRLSEVFGTWGDNLSDYTYLRVDGEVEKEDLEFLGSLPALTALHLGPANMTEEPCDGVFSGSRIETLYLNRNIPGGMVTGMPRLTTVVWGAPSRMQEGILTEAANPNILLWVTDQAMAPADAVNIVTYTYAEDAEDDVMTDPDGVGVEGTSEKITLQAGYPFGVHMPVDVESIELTKMFSLPTPIGDCGGWESIVLPFDAKSVRSEQSGELVPFKTWYEQDDVRPFWLYGATEGGWEAQSAMEAYVPYLISMPNNYEYSDDYIITGKVTFSGSKVKLAPDTSIPKSSTWLDGIEFKGTFMPVEETGIRALNLKDAAGYDYLGSAFVADGEILPFGAYIKGQGLPERIPVFGDWSGVLTPAAETVGLIVETPAPGTIRVTGSRECRTAIVTPDGAVIREIDLREGESVTVEGLTRGLYICGGVKVMVR